MQNPITPIRPVQQPVPPVVQVRSHGEKALVRQPVSLGPKVAAHAGEVMNHHDTGPRRRVVGTAQYAGMIPCSV
jgi:hypothetical protein